MIKNLDTDEIVYLYKVDAFLFGGRRLFPQNITQAEYETYVEFGSTKPTLNSGCQSE